MFLSILQHNVVSPPILFFMSGIFAGAIKSDLEVPKSISKYLSIYIMMAIGFKGGSALASASDIKGMLPIMFVGIGASVLQTFLSYGLLKIISSKMDKMTMVAVSASYGSVSILTFATAVSFCELYNLEFKEYMVALLALMEAPAIFSGLIIANKIRSESTAEKTFLHLAKEIMKNGVIVLLCSSFLIGWITGESGAKKMEGFLVLPFSGILSLFLLDMGLVVSKQFDDLASLSSKLIAFGVLMPLLSGAIGACLCYLMHLDVGTSTLFSVLLASASYIAVPAAMRIVLPEAKASVYLTLALGVTFPFNIVLGIPIFYTINRYFLS